MLNDKTLEDAYDDAKEAKEFFSVMKKSFSESKKVLTSSDIDVKFDMNSIAGKEILISIIDDKLNVKIRRNK